MSSFHAVTRFVHLFLNFLRNAAMGAAFIPFEGWDYIDTLHAVKKLIFADWERQLSMRQQRESSGMMDALHEQVITAT